MKPTFTPRVLIVGSGESGKSLLAKSIANDMEKRGMAVTVYDPINTEWSPNAFVTFNEEEFFEEIEKSYQEGRKQAVFVDEADTLLSIGQKENFWLLTRGRHFGLSTYVITQRPALVAPSARNQCNELFCFRVSESDATLLNDDFVPGNKPVVPVATKPGEKPIVQVAGYNLLDAPNLLQGEYLRCYWKDKHKALDKGRIF